MSGLGSRFAKVGYKDPKPLIPVDGHPMIAWVLKMFPGEDRPVFICRREHIEQTPMGDILKKLSPQSKVTVIEGAKLGPVAALLAGSKEIDDERPVLVSYCDYYMHWNYQAFVKQMQDSQCDGAVPCYSGFHPHLIPQKNLYACCRVDSDNNLIEIREKHSFEADKTKALHSPGVYYFKSGAIMKHYCKRLMENDDSLNGEFYVSMVYNHMVQDGLKIAVPVNVEQFCQWGTPEDLDDYKYWTNIVRKRG